MRSLLRLKFLFAASLFATQALAEGRWSAAVSLPERLQENHAAVVDGKVYVAGGINSSNETTRVAYRFDAQRNSWERIADLPEPRHHMPLVAVEGMLYAIGGFTAPGFTPKANVWRYRTETNAWEERAPLPDPRGASGAGAVGGKIVVVGGYGEGRTLSEATLVYDPPTNSWSTRAPILTKRDHLTAQVVDGILYAIGGRAISLTSNLDVVEAFDLAANQWTAKAPMPSKRGGLAAATLDGKIHTFGGERPELHIRQSRNIRPSKKQLDSRPTDADRATRAGGRRGEWEDLRDRRRAKAGIGSDRCGRSLATLRAGSLPLRFYREVARR